MPFHHIYLHIPFCERICIYCDFSVTTAKKHFEDFTRSLIRESSFFISKNTEWRLNTVYFGGGTPSYLPDSLLTDIVNHLKRIWTIPADAEWTIEINPNHCSPSKVLCWKEAGFNRLSIGVQSFIEQELKTLTRMHSAHQSETSIIDARKAGFNNINVDLIYGIPGQTLENWQLNLDKLLSFAPEHISLYALSVEEGTPLKRFTDRGKILVANEDRYFDFYLMAVQQLADAGYEHYEISNFAKPGYRSVHNSAYWKRVPYLGLGPSAHSFDGEKRWWNHKKLEHYIASCLQENTLPIENTETLSIRDILTEIIFLGLRTREGISVRELENLLQKPFYCFFAEPIEFCRDHLILTPESVSLTTQGWFLYNEICKRFIEKIP